MKVLSWNVQGLGSMEHCLVMKNMLHKYKVQIALIKESKLSLISDSVAKELWGSRHVGWSCADAVGSTGGILLLLDSCHVSVSYSWKGEFSISAVVEDHRMSKKWLMSFVYGPTSNQSRELLWKALDLVRSKWNCPWCAGGNWNMIRFPCERLGATKFSSEIQAFSDWINAHNLMDLHLNGGQFTSSNHQSPPTMSRLDRSPVSGD